MPIPRKYKEIYSNIDKYPGMKGKRVLVFDQKDESTIQLGVIGENVQKIEDVQISPTLKEFIEKWNKGCETDKYGFLSDEIYLGELLPFIKKIADAAGGNDIIIDAPQLRVDYGDILNLCYAGKVLIATEHSKPEAVARSLNWNQQVKYSPSDIIVLYSPNPNYPKAQQEERAKQWETWINEVNENLANKIKSKIINNPEDVFREMNEITGKGEVFILLGETNEASGYTEMPGGKFNARDIEDKVNDNPERKTAFINCWSLKFGYADACSKTGAGVNIGTTREVLDYPDVIEFLKLSAKKLDENGNLLDAFQSAINDRTNGRNYHFIKSALNYLDRHPGDLKGAIDYARDAIKNLPNEGSSGIQIVIDSRGIQNNDI